tara:strand:+ start:66 stop:533 length:468 start_codon:yes stop_codon:yes gene_type:complete
MNIEEVIETVKYIGVIIPIFIAVIGMWKTLAVVRVKIEAETRLSETAKVESQVKLLEIFTQIMDKAHARGPSYLSESIAKHLVDSGAKVEDYDNAVLSSSIGSAAQDAAITAIASLAAEHSFLREPALQGLKSLADILPKKDLIKQNINRIQKVG